MNKIAIVLITLCLSVTDCTAQYFSYTSDDKSSLAADSQIQEIELDNSYKLYVRCICQDAKTLQPIDCTEPTNDAVETQYVFISESKHQAVVINNIPNRNQAFYRKEGSAIAKLGHDALEFNVFFFKQFRVGRVSTSNGQSQIEFRTTDKKCRDFVWHYTLANDKLEVTSVLTKLPDGFLMKKTSSTLFLTPKFTKVDSYSFYFQVPGDGDDSMPKVPWQPQTLYVRRKSRQDITVSLNFNRDVNASYSTIKFNKSRTYAFLPE